MKNIFIKFIHKIIHIWDESDKASKYFAKPITKFYFGKWKNFGGLPVWRHGLVINIGKYGQYTNKNGENWYGNWAKNQVWDENFLKSCSAFGRFWRKFIKPTYQLPSWLSFYYSNRDIMCKTKYDSWRYEFPGQFCIVAFGICFAIYTVPPITSADHTFLTQNRIVYPDCDAYWEAVLEYNHSNSELSDEERFKKAISTIYRRMLQTVKQKTELDKLYEERKQYSFSSNEYEAITKKMQKYYGTSLYSLAIRPEHLTDEGVSLWNEVNDKYKNDKKYIKSYWI